MANPIRFGKTWQAISLKWTLSIQVLLGIVNVGSGNFNTWSLMIFVLVFFFWMSVLIKSPSFIKLSGYYMVILGFCASNSLLAWISQMKAGNQKTALGSLVDFAFCSFIAYLLWNKDKLVENEAEQIQDESPFEKHGKANENLINITQEKLKCYESYLGDEDMWTRARRPDSILSDEEWYWIDRKIGQIHMVSKGLTAPGFEKEVRDELEKSVPNETIRHEIWELGKSNFGKK